MSEKLIMIFLHKLLGINWTDSTKVNKHATLQVLGPSTEFYSFRNATTLYYFRIPKDPNIAGISSSVRIT